MWFAVVLLTSCDTEFLDVKSDKSMVVPMDLKDFRAILDNGAMNDLAPSIGEIAADDYYVEFNAWQSMSDVASRNAYIWLDDVLNDKESNDWSLGYKDILYANTVLDGLDKLKIASDEANDIRGSALFFRAFKYFHLAQVFCMPWKREGNDEVLGLPLRLGSEVEYKSVRSSLEQTYQQILEDANSALGLLQYDNSIYKTRPNKTAAHALLARIYLVMGNYKNALKHSSASLNKVDALIDYNQLNFSKSNPIERFNSEVLFHHRLSTKTIWGTSRQRIDTTLLASYSLNDLRRKAFFKFRSDSTAYFVGSYDGSATQFTGLACDEVILIKAECNVRLDNLQEAKNDMVKLLKNRTIGSFDIASIPSDKNNLLNYILMERRKQLVFRGLRWMDIRRLNALEGLNYTIEKKLGDRLYTLPPNDKRYAFLIPLQVISQSDMIQNQR